MNIKQRQQKIEIFQSLGVGDNTGMGDWMVKYGTMYTGEHRLTCV